MSRLKPVALILCATLGLSAGAAERLSPTARLRKLSLNLRGLLPSPEEYQEFSWVNSQEAEVILQKKAQSYIQSKEFERKFFERIMDSLRFNQNGDQSDINGSSVYLYQSERNFVPALKGMVNRQLSWNQVVSSPQLNALNETAESTRSLLVNFPAFYDQNIKLRNMYGINRREATEILLGVRPIPLLLTSPNARSNLERIRQLNPQAVAKAETLGTVVGLTFLKIELYRQVSRQKISNDEYVALTRSIDNSIASIEANGSPFNLFGTQFPSLTRNVDLYEFALDNAETLLNFTSNADAVDKLRERISTRTLELIQASSSKSLVGVLSTEAYLDRFRQTKFSRSAALFRIFFCDEMKPVALGGADLSIRAVRGISPRGKERASQSDETEILGDVNRGFDFRHSAEKACQGCHRKLDPAQRTFNQDANISADEPLEFVYDDENGQEKRIKVSNYADLVPAIQNQRAYKVCQARKFWNWTIGSDVPLSGSKLEEILQVYEASKSIQSMVYALVTREEFGSDTANPSQLTFETVKPIFQRCHSCHQTEPMVANFTSLPFRSKGGSDLDHVNWLERIVEQTAVLHGGRSASMPPARANWRLEEEQLKLLGRWLYQKAPDSEGRPTISETDRNNLLKGANKSSLQAFSDTETREPIFGETWLRYLEKRDFWRVLGQVFPRFTSDYRILMSCQQLVNNTGSFGFTDRLTGQVQSRKPTFGFLSLWTSCVTELISSPYFRDEKEKVILKLTNTEDFNQLSDLLVRGLPKALNDQPTSANLSTGWKKIRPAARFNLIGRIVDRLLGSGTQPNQDMIKKDIYKTINDQYENKPNATVEEVVGDIVVTIMSRDEFLSF